MLEKSCITNLVAMGDSDYEMEAAKIFAGKADHCVVKLVKLRLNPGLEELTKELVVINEKFNYIFSSYKNITIRLEKALKKKEQ